MVYALFIVVPVYPAMAGMEGIQDLFFCNILFPADVSQCGCRVRIFTDFGVHFNFCVP